MNFIDMLNSPQKAERLAAISSIRAQIDEGKLPAVEPGDDVNNHIHTTYSFSPYSPSMAAYRAYEAGLKTAGIMDHDSVAGAQEFAQAAVAIGIMGTVGVECRALASGFLADKRINNTDQDGVMYFALHGIPHQSFAEVAEFLAPYSAARGRRNRKMIDNINSIMSTKDIFIDYDNDVLPLSQIGDGGSVTERHLLYALSLKIIEKCGKGAALVDFLQKDVGIKISEKIAELLNDCDNLFYEYDLLGALKSDMVEQFYVNATDECPPIEELIALAGRVGAIAAYPYLGDVGQSVTGDKKAQKFEDDYLDQLFDELSALGVNAITYMPSRNTPEQIARLQKLCKQYEMFEISGEDINTPRQSFICYAQRAPEFAHLYDATMALIGHERAATQDIDMAMFGRKAKEKMPGLKERMGFYKTFARI